MGDIRVYLLDDHELVRTGLRRILDGAGGFEIVGESASAAEATRQILDLRPQVALLDLQLPDGSGVDVCRKVRSVAPEIRAVMFTNFDEEESLVAAAMAGASGYLMKQIRGLDLASTVRRVAAGESLIDADAAAQAVRRTRTVRPHAGLDRLTCQEERVLDLILEGLTNRKIGQRLGISEKTVKNYVTTVLQKLGVTSRTQAAVLTMQHRRA